MGDEEREKRGSTCCAGRLSADELIMLPVACRLSSRLPSSCGHAFRALRHRLAPHPEHLLPSNENQYYRRLLESRRVPLADTGDVAQPLRALEALVACGGSIEDPSYSDYVQQLTDQLPSMDRMTVLQTLQLLSRAPRQKRQFDSRNSLWCAIDAVFVREHKKSDRTPERLAASLEEALLLCSANPGRIPNFAVNLSGSLVKRLHQLDCDKDTLLRLLFCVNLARQPIPASRAWLLQSMVLRFIDHMTLGEVGLVAAAFFKTQTKLTRHELVSRIASKAANASLRTPETTVAVASILKALKYQHLPESVPFVRQLITSFTQVRPSPSLSLSLPSLPFSCASDDATEPRVWRRRRHEKSPSSPSHPPVCLSS